MQFKITLRVYTEDTDYGGVVYHANYLKFMDRARTEWLTHHFQSLHELAEQGYVFVVRHIDIDYLLPAKLNDLLEITAQISYIGNSSITFTQAVLSAENNEKVFAKAKLQLVCIHKKTLRPTRIPQILRELKHDT